MKKYLLAFAIVVLAIGVYAFATPKTTGPVPVTAVQNWYDFVGDDPNDPLDYQLHTGTPPTCNSGTKRCAVQAIQDTGIPGNYPDLQDPSIVIRNKP